MNTLSQQLKIVAAVKASSPLDEDTDQQLLQCARNLMEAVKRCLADSESASLKLLTTTATVATAAVKFRRLMYKPLKPGSKK